CFRPWSTSSKIAPSRWSPRSTAPRSAAASKSHLQAIIGGPFRPRSLACAGALEAALQSHDRVPVPSAKLGVPEVKLGLLPGAGGTQRLPRVAGVQKALEMGTSGTAISAQDALAAGLVDRLIEGDLQEHAVAYAEEVRDIRPLPKSSERQDKVAATQPGICDEFRKANARRFRGFEAPEKNIQAVEAAVAKPYAEGVLDER